ncbi:hypothetical protein AXF42_Ash005549 [Apostasia shenzhenica]|uniref:Uncharacterized protein n=1 Tax=Apostasia shenzhenica TaxID=1088818 RepID=A0A2I0B772_9ASPA|nr:hypothetical protein AXF42_Ash005549 [Apostasia shenzhenica]
MLTAAFCRTAGGQFLMLELLKLMQLVDAGKQGAGEQGSTCIPDCLKGPLTSSPGTEFTSTQAIKCAATPRTAG